MLIILVTIIVGIATVVALTTFSKGLTQSNVNAVRQDVMTIAAAGQGWYQKPDMFDGGGHDFSAVTFEDARIMNRGISSDALTVWNENGTYVIESRSTNQFTVKAYPNSDGAYDRTDPLSATDGEALTAVVKTSEVQWQ